MKNIASSQNTTETVRKILRLDNVYITTLEACIFVIITNKNTLDHFSYQNLEKGLTKIKMLIEKDQ